MLVLADLAFQSSPGRSWLRRRIRKTVNIVYYHWVGAHSAHHDGGCPLDRFRNDLKFLKQNFSIVPLQHLFDPRKERPGSPPLAVTFDDGFDLKRTGHSPDLGRKQRQGDEPGGDSVSGQRAFDVAKQAERHPK